MPDHDSNEKEHDGAVDESNNNASEPRLFTVVRNADESGVSGTGRVLDGVIFHDGQVVICWRGDLLARNGKPSEGFSSLGVYPCWDAFKSIHIDAHPSNETEIVFGNEGDLDQSVRELSLLDRNVDDGDA